jgi:hypothetical protein
VISRIRSQLPPVLSYHALCVAEEAGKERNGQTLGRRTKIIEVFEEDDNED